MEVSLAMKIGELLVSAGKLTQKQVDEVLKGQAIFGGRFGTNLVEIGYLDESELAEFLTQKTGVPHATAEDLQDIPSQIIKLISEEMAKKFKVMPISLNNRKLTLAMVDPSDFAAIDNISFRTGYIINPLIITEILLVNTLEKYYKIKRDFRFIRVEGGMRNRASSQAGGRGSATAPPAAAQRSEPSIPTLGEEYIPNNAQPAPAPQAARELNLEMVLRAFTGANDRHVIARTLTSYLAQQFDGSALFVLNGGKAVGWVARYRKQPVPDFERLEIPMEEHSALRMVAETKTHLMGPLTGAAFNSRMNEAFGGANTGNSLLLPVLLVGRVVALLYLQGGALSAAEQLAWVQKLVSKASMGLEILLLKGKIMRDE